MCAKLKLNRVLLKLSGECLKGSGEHGLDPAAIAQTAARVKDVTAAGVEVALVIGAGNLVRGHEISGGTITRVGADQMGMLATVINALAVRDALEASGVPAHVQSAIPMAGIVDCFDQRQALQQLTAKHVVIFAGGTGHPYFTTDTTAALRACEIGASAILKATKVDGVYSADPLRHPDAVRYARISYADALSQRLEVLDSTAFSLCMDNEMPLIVFRFSDPDALRRIVQGDLTCATLVSNGRTVVGAGV